MNRKGWLTIVMTLTLGMLMSAGAMGQQNTQQGPGGFGGQGGFRGQGGQGQQNFDPQEIQRQIRQTMSDRIKEALGATDEEWAVLGPRIEKIQGLVTDSNAGTTGMTRMLMGRGRGGGGGGGFAINTRTLSTMLGGSNAMAQKMQDLQDAIENPAMPESEIKSRLTAVRAEREKVRAELVKQRAELTQLLTQRQEAMLFSLGILE